MKSLIIFALLTISSNVLAEQQARKSPYEICICSFSGCLGARNISCFEANQCRKVTAQEHSNALNNKASIMMIINPRAFCIDPRSFYLKN